MTRGQWEGHSTAQPGPQGSVGACAFSCCGRVLALCIPQEFQGTAPQSNWCWTRSSDRTLVSLELLNSGQKQKEGSARRKLLEDEAHKPWEGAPGAGDTRGRVFIKAGIKLKPQISFWGWTGMAPSVATLLRGPTAAQPYRKPHRENPPVPEPKGSCLAPFQPGKPRRRRKL